MYVHVCVYVPLCMCVSVSACMYMYVCMCMYHCVYVCVCLCACMYVHVCVYVPLCMCVCVSSASPSYQHQLQSQLEASKTSHTAAIAAAEERGREMASGAIERLGRINESLGRGTWEGSNSLQVLII